MVEELDIDLLVPSLNINPQSWTAWKNDPVTIEVVKALQTERNEWATRLLEGMTLKAGEEISATARAVGAVYGLDYFLLGLEEMLQRQWEVERLRKIAEE